MTGSKWRTPVLHLVRASALENVYYERVDTPDNTLLAQMICSEGLKELMKWDSLPELIQLEICTEYSDGSNLIHLLHDESVCDTELPERRQIKNMIRQSKSAEDDLECGIRTGDGYFSMTGTLSVWLVEQKIFSGFYWLSRVPSTYESDSFAGLVKPTK